MPNPPPNILVIMADDHGIWASQPYGNPEVHTPTLSFLAEKGGRMANAFTPSPVCSPARMSFFTGRFPSQHGVHDWIYEQDDTINTTRWLDQEVMLGTLFQQAGYHTALVGKWHGGQSDQPQPGFDTWFNFGRGWMNNHAGPHLYSHNGQPETHTGYKSQVITDFALNWLRQHHNPSNARPFFLFLGYNTTHNPWAGHPERLVNLYRDAQFAAVQTAPEYRFGELTGEATLPTRLNQRAALAEYYAAVTEMDEQIGRVVDWLQATGLAENTLLVYTGDHGLCAGQHGFWGKGDATIPYNALEESIRIPLLFYQPGSITSGQVCTDFTDHTDTFQTLLAAAQISPPPHRNYPGRNLLPFLQTAAPPHPTRDYQIIEYATLRAIRTARHKLVLREPGGPHHFFDLIHDSRETHDLYTDFDQHATIAHLTEQLNRWFATFTDPAHDLWQGATPPQFNPWEPWRPPPDQIRSG